MLLAPEFIARWFEVDTRHTVRYAYDRFAHVMGAPLCWTAITTEREDKSLANQALTTVPPKLPHHLNRQPLVEVTFEFRFKPARPSVAQLLPGLIFAHLHDKYGRSEATPFASIPSKIREIDPNLRYQADYRLSGDRASISIGEHVAGLNVTAPYEGWARFRSRVLEFLKIVQDSHLVDKVERFSIKFVNIIPAPPGTQLDLLNLRVEIGGIRPPEDGFKLRTEINDNTYIRIVELATNAGAHLPSGEDRSGLLLVGDCIRTLKGEDFWSIHADGIDQLHLEAKQLFFGLITQKTLESLEPSYEEHG